MMTLPSLLPHIIDFLVVTFNTYPWQAQMLPLLSTSCSNLCIVLPHNIGQSSNIYFTIFKVPHIMVCFFIDILNSYFMDSLTPIELTTLTTAPPLRLMSRFLVIILSYGVWRNNVSSSVHPLKLNTMLLPLLWLKSCGYNRYYTNWAFTYLWYQPFITTILVPPIFVQIRFSILAWNILLYIFTLFGKKMQSATIQVSHVSSDN